MNKSRYWSFIAYPESTPKNWIEELCKKGVVFAVSPLHDKDINADGEKKKEHWHILVQFEGPTTYKNVKENICDIVNGTIPQKVLSLRGYYRYLTHLDNPEKYQYKQEEIKEYGGFKLELTTTETMALKIEILNDIEKNEIEEYADIIDMYRDIGDIDKLDISSHNTYFFDRYITSKRNKVDKNKKK